MKKAFGFIFCYLLLQINGWALDPSFTPQPAATPNPQTPAQLASLAGLEPEKPLGPGVGPEPKGELTITISHLRNQQGTLYVLLFGMADGFPDSAEKAFRKKSLVIANTTQSAVFVSIPYGNYAVSVLQDEKNDQQVRYNWLGKPLQGNGVSNGVRKWFGRPSFKQAQFELHHPKQEITVEVAYP